MIVVTSSCVASGSIDVQDGGSASASSQDGRFSRGASRRTRRPRRRRRGRRSNQPYCASRSKPARSSSRRHSGGESHARQHRRRLLAAPHGEGQRPLVLVPVGALEDPGLALEPAAVRLLDVVRPGAKTSKTRRPPGSEQLARGARARAAGPPRSSCAGASGTGSGRAGRARHRRLAQVAVPQVEQLGDPLLGRVAAARPRACPADASTPMTRTPGLGDRHGDPAGAARELHHRPAGRRRLLDVELDVLDDARRPRVVDPGDRVIRACGQPRRTRRRTRRTARGRSRRRAPRPRSP